MPFDDHRSTTSTVRAATADPNLEPASPPFPPRTPDPAFSALSGRSISLGLLCFCGNTLESRRKSGMFCSADCARTGTFSSLTAHQLPHRMPPPSQLSEALVLNDNSRVPSASSDYYDEASPHPRAMARADQRREERRRRRADPIDLGVHSPMIARSSTCPDMPSASPNIVPDLISSHSRNTSSASSIFSLASGGLSRNGSVCSSHHRQPSSVAIGAAIMEVDGEDSPEMALARSTLKARAYRRNQNASRRSLTHSTSSSSSSDMRVHDMLDELIQMERSFRVDDLHALQADTTFLAPERVPTPVFTPLQHPPRTPSPVNSGSAMVPPAPGGIGSERRNSLNDSRPSSTFAHQSSLSESHTALYLATASPLQSSTSSSERNRRSASPQLHVRRSIVFTPSHAGPALPPSPRRYDSPSRRKPGVHPDMTWRFPKTEFDDDDYSMPEPSGLLWPSNNSSSSSLAASAFPTSHASMNLAELATTRPMGSLVPPRSALRLNMLMADDDTDIDMESEVSDDRSTVRGSIVGHSIPPSTSFAQRGW